MKRVFNKIEWYSKRGRRGALTLVVCWRRVDVRPYGATGSMNVMKSLLSEPESTVALVEGSPKRISGHPNV